MEQWEKDGKRSRTKAKGSTAQKPQQKVVQPIPAIHEGESSDILQSLLTGNAPAEKSRGMSSGTLLTLKTHLQVIGMAHF